MLVVNFFWCWLLFRPGNEVNSSKFPLCACVAFNAPCGRNFFRLTKCGRIRIWEVSRISAFPWLTVLIGVTVFDDGNWSSLFNPDLFSYLAKNCRLLLLCTCVLCWLPGNRLAFLLDLGYFYGISYLILEKHSVW